MIYKQNSLNVDLTARAAFNATNNATIQKSSGYWNTIKNNVFNQIKVSAESGLYTTNIIIEKQHMEFIINYLNNLGYKINPHYDDSPSHVILILTWKLE